MALIKGIQNRKIGRIPSIMIADRVKVNGLIAWLRADMGITKDINDYVSNWVDLSGNSFNAYQYTQVNKPLWVANVLNGNPVLRFSSGGTSILNIPSIAFTNHTVFITWSYTTYNGYNRTTIFGNNNDTTSKGLFIYAGNTLMYGTTSAYISYGIPAVPFTNFIITSLVAGSTASIYQDSTVKVSGTNTYGAVTQISAANHSVYSSALMADIAEIRIYNGTLNNVERAAVWLEMNQYANLF